MTGSVKHLEIALLLLVPIIVHAHLFRGYGISREKYITQMRGLLAVRQLDAVTKHGWRSLSDGHQLVDGIFLDTTQMTERRKRRLSHGQPVSILPPISEWCRLMGTCSNRNSY